MSTERLDELLAAAARRHPSRPALDDGTRTWSYAELDEVVGSLAERLSADGAAGWRIGVLATKSAAAVIAIHAALRAGAVVAPLDVRSPVERLRRIVYQGGLTDLLVPRRGMEQKVAAGLVARAGDPDASAAGRRADAVDVGHELDRIPSGTGVADPLPAPLDEGGYVLFTSGSTGWPKGAALTHANVAHFARWAAAECGLTEHDRIGSQAALTFDLTTFDLFAAAAAGACTVLMPERLRTFPASVLDWIADHRITVVYAVPSLYVGLLATDRAATGLPGTLRMVLYAGERFPPSALESFLALAGDRPVYNFYGPTETNVCTFTRIPTDWHADQDVTVGRAIPGDTVAILDENGRPGEGPGELVVAGATVFQGYLEGGALRDPTQALPFDDGLVRRAYRTGDLGRRIGGPDGEILLLGRRDEQIKRRGHRIDLGEVESAALEVGGVHDAAATLDGTERLEVFVSGDAEPDHVAEHLRRRVPVAMLPDQVAWIPEVPRTDRGKIDRQALEGLGTPEPTAEHERTPS